MNGMVIMADGTFPLPQMATWYRWVSGHHALWWKSQMVLKIAGLRFWRPNVRGGHVVRKCSRR